MNELPENNPPVEQEDPKEATLESAINEILTNDEPGEDSDDAPNEEAESEAPAVEDENNKESEGGDGEDEEQEPDLPSNKTSKERFANLSNKVRDVSKQLEEAQKINTDFTAQLQGAGVDSDSMGAFLRMMRAFKVGDYQDAHGLSQVFTQHFAQLAGIDGGGVDLLAGYPDLAQQVDSLELSREHAVEIAGARNATARMKQGAQTNQRMQAQAEQAEQQNARVLGQHEAAKQQALQDIQELDESWRRTDPDYTAKIEHIKGYAAELNAQLEAQMLLPEQLKPLLQSQYKLVSTMIKPVKGKSSGLRPSAARGKPAAENLSMSDAINNILDGQ